MVTERPSEVVELVLVELLDVELLVLLVLVVDVDLLLLVLLVLLLLVFGVLVVLLLEFGVFVEPPLVLPPDVPLPLYMAIIVKFFCTFFHSSLLHFWNV